MVKEGYKVWLQGLKGVAARVTRCGCKGYKVLLQGLQDIVACITYNRSNLSERSVTLQAKLI
jgi:hypothetical protein